MTSHRLLLPLGMLALLLATTACQPSRSIAPAAAPSADDLRVLMTFPAGGEGGWDYPTFDPDSHRLYLAHATRVMVLDADKGTLIGEVADTPGVHGVAVVPDRNLGFATNGRDSSVSVFDLKTLQTLKKIKAGKKPDAILYDPASKRVFAFNGDSGDITIIDPAALDQEPATLAVGGKLEFGATDGAGRVYVNVEDKSQLVAIDSKQQKIVARWPLAPGEEPTGLAIDPVHRRLFAGCSKSQTLVVLDADTGAVLGSAPIGAGQDGVAFDPKLGVALSANGRDGTLTVVGQGADGKFQAIKTINTVKTARTIAADPKTGRVYMPCTLPAQGSQPATFGVMVVGRVFLD
jgi:DNA-binding beta-propeller fold protein YncE